MKRVIPFFLLFILFVGCTSLVQNHEQKFSELVPGTIGQIFEYIPMDGTVYQTTDPTLIQSFVSDMAGPSYVQVSEKSVPPVSGDFIPYLLYDETGKELGKVTFVGEQFVRINDKVYKITKKIDSSFFTQLRTSKYKGKALNFQEIITKGIGKVQYRSSKGMLYETKEDTLIDQFISIMKKSTYVETGPRPLVTGRSPLVLFDQGGHEMGKIYFKENGYVQIFGSTYKALKNVPVETFFNALQKEKNKVKE